MAPDGALENLRDVGSKAAENAARIAGVLTIIENPEATTIDGEAMTSGCELAAWYVDEAFRLSDAYRQSPSLRNAIPSARLASGEGQARNFRSRDYAVRPFAGSAKGSRGGAR